MSDILEIQVTENTKLFLEATDVSAGRRRSTAPSGYVDVGKNDDAGPLPGGSLKDLFNTLGPITEAFLNVMDRVKPTSSELTFGIQATLGGGFIIKAGGKANFSVTLKWDKPQKLST